MNPKARVLRDKAMSLQGYARMIDEGTAEEAMQAAEACSGQKWLRKE